MREFSKPGSPSERREQRIPHPTSPESAAELAARARELDIIQHLGRRAAEAHTPDELFTTTIGLLAQVQDLDLAVVAHALDGHPEMLVLPARPFDAGYLASVRRVAAKMLGWQAGVEPRVKQPQRETFDHARPPRNDFREEDLIVLPILRDQAPIAYLLVVLAGPPVGEDRLRLLYSATNQLSLQLERILAAREAEADRFRAILESMPQAVLLTDDQLRIVQTNGAARRLLRQLDMEDEELAAQRLGLGEIVARARECAGDVADAELVLEDRVYGITASRLSPNRNRPQGWVLVLADVTESRRLQQQLAQSEKMSSLGQMLSGVAHELNNPLATISGYSQLLRNASRDPALSERLEVLYGETQRCQKIVRNLLSFARQHEPERRPVSLNEIVRAVSALMQYQLRVADIRLDLELNPGLPPLMGDGHLLQQVLVNLVSNASHAVQGSERQAKIVIRTALERPDIVVLEVCDNGPGISDSIRSKIFDPFFTTKPEGQGTGLGLSLVYGVIAAHGGQIEALRSEGGGATMRIALPVADSVPEVVDAASLPEEAPISRPGQILVVDDEPAFARLVCEALTVDGHSAEMARDGHEALERAGQREFDVIVSDLKMPGMSGERLYHELESLRSGCGRRLLLTTGDTVSSEAAGVGHRTGVEILHKPLDLDQLRRLVRARLARESQP